MDSKLIIIIIYAFCAGKNSQILQKWWKLDFHVCSIMIIYFSDFSMKNPLQIRDKLMENP